MEGGGIGPRANTPCWSATRNYWDNKANSKYLLIKIIPDSNARVVAFETGQIDLIYGGAGHGAGQIGLDSFENYRHMPGVVTKVSAPLATRVLAMNTKRFPTNDIAVRKAILHAVDRDALVKHIFMGVEPRADALFSPAMPYCDLKLQPYGFDRSGAETLLDEAGWVPGDDGYRTKDGRELALDLCFAGNDALMKSVAEVVQGRPQESRHQSQSGGRGKRLQPCPAEERRIRHDLRQHLGRAL